MKKAVLLLILLIFSQPLMAQDSPNSAEPKPDSSTSTKEAVKEGAQQPPAIWPKPFKPSEEIRADSQISFPTDI